MSSPAIDLRSIRLDFADGTRLFEDFSLTVEAARCCCILGPSGCGKSTLLRLISGSQAFSFSGELRFFPDSAGSSPCAWMGQDDLLLPWFTLLDNVLLGARLRGEMTNELRGRASRLIADAGLAGHETALPAALSGGMRQRGALLRTLMEEKPVLLMDEPFSALDALTRIRLQNLAATMTRGATVVLVTHDPLEALRVADRIIILAGSPARVKTEFVLSGPVPRRPDDPEIARHYAELLAQLMEEA